MANELILPGRPELPQDRTGRLYDAQLHPARIGPAPWFSSPAWLECPECHSRQFRVVADQHTAAMQLVCENWDRCHRVTHPFSLHAVQMEREHAQALGLALPGPSEFGRLDMTVDVPNDD